MGTFEERHAGETREVDYGDGTHEWAPYPDALDFGKLAAVARNMIEQVADVEVTRKPGDEGVEYDGPPLHPRFFVASFKPREALSKEKLDFAEQDQGRDALEEVLAVVLQMGVEQGLRMARGEWTDMEKVERRLSDIKERIDEFPDDYLDLQIEMIKHELDIS